MTWVHDQIFAAGGEYLPSEWASFSEQTGIACILHLRPKRPAIFCGPPAKAFLWLEVAEEGEADQDCRLLAARFLEGCLQQGERVLLHSSLGRHRTRWAYVAYELHQGRTLKAALRRAAERPWLAPYYTDVKAWESFAEAIDRSRMEPNRQDADRHVPGRSHAV